LLTRKRREGLLTRKPLPQSHTQYLYPTTLGLLAPTKRLTQPCRRLRSNSFCSERHRAHPKYFQSNNECELSVGKKVPGASNGSGDRFDVNASRPTNEAQCDRGNFKLRTTGTHCQPFLVHSDVPPSTRELTVKRTTGRNQGFQSFTGEKLEIGCVQGTVDGRRSFYSSASKKTVFARYQSRHHHHVQKRESYPRPRELVGKPWVDSRPTSLPKSTRRRRRPDKAKEVKKTYKTDLRECACTRSTFLAKTVDSLLRSVPFFALSKKLMLLSLFFLRSLVLPANTSTHRVSCCAGTASTRPSARPPP
jgi:hypothetical protein